MHYFVITFQKNIADSDSCFVNASRTNIINNSLNKYLKL